MISEMEIEVEVTQSYPFKVSLNNPEAVKVLRTGHDPGQLRTTNGAKYGTRKTVGGLTSCKRFAPGLDLAHSTTFPFCIQAETMRKE